MYIFVKATIIYSKNGVGLIFRDKLICDNSDDNLPKEIIETLLKEKPEYAYVKYARASSGFYDDDDNWHWDLLAPIVDYNSQFIVKLHQSNFTREELISIISEFEFDGGRIPDPIGLLNRFFEILHYPSKYE